jgi:hypothetical protein
MKRFVASLLTVAALAVATPALAEEMHVITVGADPLPIRLALILYTRVDPGATEVHFYLDNPQHVGSTYIMPGDTFLAPISDRSST